MKKALNGSIAVLFILGIFAPSARAGDTLFESEGMRGVSIDFLNPVEIRGVRGPGAPWVLESGEVEIRDVGMGSMVRLRVKVEELVLDPATVPAPVGGTNPVPNFRAIVSCLDGVDAGTPTFTNVVSETFPADEEGEAKLDTLIMLPDPCFGIVVFVTSPGERWFAVTGAAAGF